MEKVFVVITTWHFDSGEIGNEVKAFATGDLAYDYYVDCKNELKSIMVDIYDEDEIEEREKGYSYETWEKDNYCFNNQTVKMVELKVEG